MKFRLVFSNVCFTYISLLIIFFIIVYVTNKKKEMLNLEKGLNLIRLFVIELVTETLYLGAACLQSKNPLFWLADVSGSEIINWNDYSK